MIEEQPHIPTSKPISYALVPSSKGHSRKKVWRLVVASPSRQERSTLVTPPIQCDHLTKNQGITNPEAHPILFQSLSYALGVVGDTIGE